MLKISQYLVKFLNLVAYFLWTTLYKLARMHIRKLNVCYKILLYYITNIQHTVTQTNNNRM